MNFSTASSLNYISHKVLTADSNMKIDFLSNTFRLDLKTTGKKTTEKEILVKIRDMSGNRSHTVHSVNL